MEKAVTPVISLILLILLMLAIAGGTYYWVIVTQGNIQQSAGESAERAVSTEIPFSITSYVCYYATDKFNFIISNNGPRDISSSANFIMAVSDINSIGLGSNTSLIKSSNDIIPVNGVLQLEGTIQGLDLQPNTEYVVKLFAGTTVQTVICNSQ